MNRQFLEEFVLAGFECGDLGLHSLLASRERIGRALRIAMIVPIKRGFGDQRAEAGVISFVRDLAKLRRRYLGLFTQFAEALGHGHQPLFDPLA